MRIERPAEHAEVRPQRADELASPYHRTTHHIAGSGSVLGQAVDEHVDLVLTMLVQPREGVVHHHESACALGEPGDRRDVRDLGHRVGRALEPHEPGRMRCEGALDSRKVLDRQHGMGHAEATQEAADQIARRIIGLDETEDVIALLGQREQRLRHGTDTGSRHQTLLASLQLREQQLELARGGIRGTRIEESGPLAAQIALGLLQGLEFELDALIDRRHHRMVVGGELYRWRMIDSGWFFHVLMLLLDSSAPRDPPGAPPPRPACRPASRYRVARPKASAAAHRRVRVEWWPPAPRSERAPRTAGHRAA